VTDTQLYLIDPHNAATCLSCILPDCIYCLDEPAIELRRLCPIWLSDNHREQARLTALRARNRKRKEAARGDEGRGIG
jgi:hypothetical protein